ncbi:hypothetical protein Patl1_24849 [Pistacia atlantica]|uniref:Uncharacterized protein n=1 Tax=Pistacia atlantica TaxID=434234 RepID=A0ACC1B261_9ROSI|nr:hypothetical protein Patl1_24849 [Pistacia atlantica]
MKIMRSRRQARERSICKKHRRRNIIMKRRVVKEGYKRSIKGNNSRIRTLKELVNGKSLRLDELFKETADFIMCLQTKVMIMQTMIKLLSPSDE